MTTGKYKLIVSDFDGTLARSDGTVGEKTLRAIREYRSAGGVFAVCTGRMLPSILPEVKKLGLTGLLVSYQGSVVSDIETGEILRFVGFDKRAAVRVCKALEELKLNIHLYTIDTLYVNYRNEYLDRYESVCKIRSERVKGKLSSFIEQGDFVCIKLVAVTAEETLPAVFKAVSDRLGKEFYVTSSASILVEVTPKTHTKASGVNFLSEYYHIEKPEIIALGDNLNDLPMLQAAGLGVAVGNAVKELKDQADEVASSNDEDAVCRIIQKYGMGGYYE